MTRTCLQALLSHWRRNPLQLFTFLAGLALATALWSGVQAINSEARASYDAAAATLGDGQFDQITARNGGLIALSDYVALRRGGWLVSPVMDGPFGGVRVIGLDPLTSPQTLLPGGSTGAPDLAGFLQRRQVFANKETAEQLADLLPANTDLIQQNSIAPGLALMDISTAQVLLGQSDLSRLVVQPVQPLGRAPLDQIAPHLVQQSATQTSDIGALTDSFHLNLTAFGLLSFAVGIFIVQSAIGLAFEQRRAMIRTLRALGVPLRLLVGLICVEMLGLALIGGGLGVGLGYGLAGLLLPDVAATLRGLYGAQVSGTLQLRPEWWLSGLGIAVLGTALAMAGRIWQIARMPLLHSAQPRAWAQGNAKALRWQAIAAAGLLSCAAGLAIWGSGLVASFALLACLLIGAALALPLGVGFALHLLQQRARSATTQWFWADTQQQLPGLSLALMAMLLAIAANIGVSTMVSSFRLTFVGFLDQRLAPELYIRLDTADLGPQVETLLAREATEVMPLLRAEALLDGQKVEHMGIRVGPTYRENWRLIAQTSDVWDRVSAGSGVVVNEQLARRNDLWLMDSLPLAPGQSTMILGVVGDYGNPQGQVILSEGLFQQIHPNIKARQFGARTRAPQKLRALLQEELHLPDSAMIDQASLKAFSLGVFERTFTVTAALNVLTLAVAGFALLMSLLTLTDQRLPQLAPVWALGLTRRHLGQLELIRAGALTLLVTLLALPLGLALAWVLLAIVNVEAFGWRLPMFLFPLSYLWLAAAALLAAALAAAWPAWRLSQMPPARLLKVFADER